MNLAYSIRLVFSVTLLLPSVSELRAPSKNSSIVKKTPVGNRLKRDLGTETTNKTMQTLRLFSVLLLLLTSLPGHTQKAQFHGIAEYNLLRKPYYIGVLRLAEPTNNPQLILKNQSPQHMAFKVKNDWSPKRFYKTWREAIHANNPPDVIEAQADNIEQFLSLAKSYLLQGDTVLVFFNGERTVVRLNDTKAFHVEGKAFFNTLVSAWIGDQPPSPQFKANLLAGKKDEALLSQFTGMKANTSRQLITESWFFGETVLSQSAAKDLIKEGQLPKPAPVTSQGLQYSLAQVQDSFDDLRLFIAARDALLKPTDMPENADELSRELKEAKALLYKMHRQSFQHMALASAEFPSEQDLLDDGLSMTQAMQKNEYVAVRIKVNRYGQVISIKPVAESTFESFNNAAISAIRRTSFTPAVPELSAQVFEKLIKVRFKKGQIY